MRMTRGREMNNGVLVFVASWVETAIVERRYAEERTR